MDSEPLNKGIAFTNDYKKEDKHPVYKGRGNWNGEVFDIAVWERTDKNGKKYLSMQFSEYKPYQKDKVAEVPEDDINLDNIPF